MSILTFLLIGVFAGWLASMLIDGHGLGIVGDLIIGVMGAFIGGFIFDILGVSIYSFWASVGMSVVGAIIFLVVVGFFTRPIKPLRKL